MKKAKIMLTAITVLAVVGGALAFKAKKSDTIFCSTITSPIGLCPILLHSTWETPGAEFSYCTTNGAECDLKVHPIAE